MTLLGTYLMGRLLWRLTSPTDNFAAVIFTIGGIMGTWMVASQINSLFRGITPLPFGFTVLVIGTILQRLTKSIESTAHDPDYSFKRYIQEAYSNKLNFVILIGIASIAFVTAITSYLIHPWGDNYHFSKPAYWVQNQSLLPFHCHNFRITCFAPGGNIHHLPFYLYFSFQKSNIIISLLCLLI